MKVLSIRKVLEQAGGSTALAAMMDNTGQPRPSIYTIGMWKQRGLIPGWWAGCVIYALAAHGVHPLHLLDETHPAVIRPEMASTDDADELLRQADEVIAANSGDVA